MTKAEAIKALEIELNQWEADCKSYHAVKEALPMAIDALKYTHACNLTDDHICHFPWLKCAECEVQHKELGLVKIDDVLEIIDKEFNEFADSVCKDLPNKEEEYIRVITAMYMTRCKDVVSALKGGEQE